jgi:hypothetical protein
VASVERVAKRAAIIVAVIYGSWLGMLAVHEFGHVIHAWLSGGRVERIIFPPLGFSQTIVWPNPHARFVVWGGPMWGAILPLILMFLIRLMRRKTPELLKFFAGLCLIANGGYLAFGGFALTGDAADLRRLGTPLPVIIAMGSIAITGGLLLWHRSRWLTGRPRETSTPKSE